MRGVNFKLICIRILMISAKPAKNEKCQNICFSNIWRGKCIIMVLNLHRRQWMSNTLRWRQNSSLLFYLQNEETKKYILKYICLFFISICFSSFAINTGCLKVFFEQAWVLSSTFMTIFVVQGFEPTTFGSCLRT